MIIETIIATLVEHGLTILAILVLIGLSGFSPGPKRP